MLKEFRGTEKQLKYAEDIKNSFIHLVIELKNAIEKYSKDDEMKEKYMNIYNNEIVSIFNSYENAGDFINDWKDILKEEDEVAKINFITEKLKEKNITITARIISKMKNDFFVEY